MTNPINISPLDSAALAEFGKPAKVATLTAPERRKQIANRSWPNDGRAVEAFDLLGERGYFACFTGTHFVGVRNAGGRNTHVITFILDVIFSVGNEVKLPSPQKKSCR